MHIGVVGGGWAGLAAAHAALKAGHTVSLWEMAPVCGGRARTVPNANDGYGEFDNGQHILIGAYRRTLAILEEIGVDVRTALHRMPLTLVDGRGQGLRLEPGSGPIRTFWALLRHPQWTRSERWSLCALLVKASLQGFRCSPSLTVSQWAATLRPRVQRQWLEPLCVAALNTPASSASAQVFLRVLADGVLGGVGASDLLLPRRSLGALWVEPLLRHLERGGAKVHLRCRVNRLERATSADATAGVASAGAWMVHGTEVDALVLACSAPEAARLLEPWAPEWAERSQAVRFESILTCWIHSPGTRLAAPMLQLPPSHNGDAAQFLFDLGAIGHPMEGWFTAVASAVREPLQAGVTALEASVRQQLVSPESGIAWATAPRLVRSITERRATFECSPALVRPSASPLPLAWRLQVAGDYVEGPYPSTLEGAVISGEAAVAALHQAY